MSCHLDPVGDPGLLGWVEEVAAGRQGPEVVALFEGGRQGRVKLAIVDFVWNL